MAMMRSASPEPNRPAYRSHAPDRAAEGYRWHPGLNGLQFR